MEEVAISDLGLAQATVATLGAAMIIGLGFLQRPSRASLLWSLAFLLAMVSTWVSLAGAALSEEGIRRAGLGLLLGAPALIWSGLRARGPRRAYPWIAPVQSVLSAAALVAVGDSGSYGLVFRCAFFAAAVFAGLALIEIRRSPDRHERLVIPLTLVSGAFAVLGAFILISGLIFPPGPGDDLQLVRALNSLGMLVYLVCATTTLLFFTSVSTVGVQTAWSWPQFTVTATDRLARARAAGETSWVMLAVRLDDPRDIGAAMGEGLFSRIVDRFEQTVRASFPAESDVGREARGHLMVLMSRPGPVIREHVRTMLRSITEMDAAQQIAVQLSASVGWAPADVVGYDFAALVAAAQRAADEASELGGDRWQRIES